MEFGIGELYCSDETGKTNSCLPVHLNKNQIDYTIGISVPKGNSLSHTVSNNYFSEMTYGFKVGEFGQLCHMPHPQAKKESEIIIFLSEGINKINDFNYLRDYASYIYKIKYKTPTLQKNLHLRNTSNIH